MEKYIDLAEFKFEFEDRKSIETRCKVGSRLYINDEFITDMLKRNDASKESVESLRITLGVDNAAIEIEDYTLTPKIEINSFYNIPSHIAIFQSRNTDVDILGQNIGRLQADCSRVMLADCQVKQADIGLRNLYTQKFKSNESGDKATVCKMTSLDIRACNIDILKSYIGCDSINIQESSIRWCGLYGALADGKCTNINIWNYSTLEEVELHCEIQDFKIENSTISIMNAKAKCKIGSMRLVDSDIQKAYNFSKENFANANAIEWMLVSKSTENSGNTKLRSEANYQMLKEKYKQEKGPNVIGTGLFNFCTGYGYKPFRIFAPMGVLVVISFLLLFIEESFAYGYVKFDSIGRYFKIALAGLAGQSGLSIQCGFPFWIVTLEYLLGVILFAMFVNALYVRYKD